MVSPKPVPPYCRVVEASAWVKGAKIRSWSSGAMPMPVSDTANSRVTSCGSDDCTVGANCHFALGGELDRVAYEIHQHLPQPQKNRR